MYLALDIGNVLVDVDLSEFTEKCKSFDSPSEAEYFLTAIQIPNDLGITTIQGGILTHRIARQNITGYSDNIHDTLICWNKTLRANSMSIAYLEKALSLGINVALVSNMGSEHRAIIRDVVGPAFDRCVPHISCEVGARKPQMLYYQSFLIQNHEFKNAVYVDDRSENLVAGHRHGLRSIHIDTAKMQAAELDARWEKIIKIVLGEESWDKSLYTDL